MVTFQVGDRVLLARKHLGWDDCHLDNHWFSRHYFIVKPSGAGHQSTRGKSTYDCILSNEPLSTKSQFVCHVFSDMLEHEAGPW